MRAALWLLAAFTAGCAAGGLVAGSALWFGVSVAVAAGTWIGLDITRAAELTERRGLSASNGRSK